MSLNAITPGFEKTFLGGAMSVEVRLPMASTLDNNVYLDGTTSTGVGQIGNLGISIKAVLYRTDTFLFSGGLGIHCPTAPDMLCFGITSGSGGGGGNIQLLNQSVHLLPFFGGVWTPNDRLFVMGFMQFDLDANGDPINNVDVDFPVCRLR